MYDSKFEEQKNIMNNSLSSTEDKIKAAEYILEHTPIPETTKVELVKVPSTIHEVKLTDTHLSLIYRCIKHGLLNSHPVWNDEEYMNLIVIRELLESYK